MKLHLVSAATESKIKMALFILYIGFLHALAFAGAASIVHSILGLKIFGPF